MERPALQVMRENRLQVQWSVVLQINLPLEKPALQVMRENRLQVAQYCAVNKSPCGEGQHDR